LKKKPNRVTLIKMAKKKLSPETLEYFRKQGRIGGKMSGAARMAKLTPEQRSALAKKASLARWKKAKP
jgi:hypothetical protein